MRRQGLTYEVFKTHSFSIILHPPTLTFPDPNYVVIFSPSYVFHTFFQVNTQMLYFSEFNKSYSHTHL